jgi:hypothetical protein
MTANALKCTMFEDNSPHPVPLPMGEGTVLRAPRIIQGSPLHLHPLADADTLRRKLAKASLRGEGQGEGRVAQYNQQLNDPRRHLAEVAA